MPRRCSNRRLDLAMARSRARFAHAANAGAPAAATPTAAVVTSPSSVVVMASKVRREPGVPRWVAGSARAARRMALAAPRSLTASRRAAWLLIGSTSPGRGQGSPRVTLRPAPWPPKGTPAPLPKRHRIGTQRRCARIRVALSPHSCPARETPVAGVGSLRNPRRAALAVPFPMPGRYPPFSGYRSHARLLGDPLSERRGMVLAALRHPTG
jgi:hypothetical protein